MTAGFRVAAPNSEEKKMIADPRPRVLYVDDDEDSREMLSMILSDMGIETMTAATGAQALERAKAERFDLYLLDGWLPDLDGFELCRRLRIFDRDTPILFYSGAGYDEDRRRGTEAGADDYVVKPDVEGLLRSLSQLVFPSQSPVTADQIATWKLQQLRNRQTAPG
jgi:DNA-binding response OmpR family regulator